MQSHTTPARPPGRRDGGTSKHLGCGDGRIDCDKSLQLLKQGGSRGWTMVDEWEVPDPYDACLKCQRVIDAVGRSADIPVRRVATGG